MATHFLFAATGLSAQTLTLGTKLELNTLDPHFFAAFPTGSSHELIYEKLAVRDDKLVPRPQLAASWKNLDDLTWEIKLRKGVVFHDGAPFTADDVIFTWERVPNVPNSPNSFSQFTRSEVVACKNRQSVQLRRMGGAQRTPSLLRGAKMGIAALHPSYGAGTTRLTEWHESLTTFAQPK